MPSNMIRLQIALWASLSAAAGSHIPQKVTSETWRGMLIDAGCPDRSRANLRQPPDLAPAPTQGPASTGAGLNSHGISVDAKTLQAERGDALATHTPDHLTREQDASCGITGGTRGVALWLPDGTLLNLDEGGNTMVLQLFQSTPRGRAILNGRAGGEKPRAVIQGVRVDDELKVESVRLE